ncbi:MAG: DUF4167 domain-containing protein [Rhizomicrobium sp.]
MTEKFDNRATKQKASSAPRGKVRPNHSNADRQPDGQSQWQRHYDHYRNLAQQAGNADSVTREQYWQHAEHYCRLMNGSAFQQT